MTNIKNLFLKKIPTKNISKIKNLKKKNIKFIINTLNKILINNNLYNLKNPTKNPPSLKKLYNPTTLLLNKIITPKYKSKYKFLISLTKKNYTTFLFIIYYLKKFLSKI